MARPKMYVLLSNCGHLEPISGDRIETLRFMMSLHQFCDVYYNEMKFDPTRADFGMHEKAVELPKDRYDLYYVRNNNEIFKKVPGPKITMAYPYDAEVFESAEALLVTTAEWKRLLENYNHDASTRASLAKWYPQEGIVAPKMVFNMQQAFSPAMLRWNDRQVEIFRARFSSGIPIGYFGRITQETLPNMMLSALNRLRKRHPKLAVVMAGRIATDLPGFAMNFGRLAFDEMPHAVRACQAVMVGEDRDHEFLGAGKVLEAMAVGTPVISKKNPVRVEQLGEDYPLFYDNEESAYDVTDRLLSDETLFSEIRDRFEERRDLFSIDAQAQRLENFLVPLMSWKTTQ